MRRFLTAGLVAAGCCAQAQTTAPPPAATLVVNALTPSAAPRDGFTRLRLSLTSDESSTTEVVRLAGIALCSHSVCYESAAPGSVTLSSTANGSSTTVAELEVPFSDIASVRFKFVGGPGVLQGSVALPEPFKLERDFQGGDVLVVVQRRGAGYVPAAAAANYLQPEGTSLYYNPTFAMKAKLPHGVSISIPAGALRAPQVFIVGVHDNGDEYPSVDIYPEVKLTKPATVELPVIQRVARALQSNQPPPVTRPQPVAPDGSLASQAPAAPATSSVRVEFNATGYIRRKPQAPAASKPMNSSAVEQPTLEAAVTAAASCNAAGWCNCADQLAFPANQLIIANGLTPTGTTYLNWCTTITPYVHITVSDLGDSRERFTIKHEPRVIPPNYVDKQLPLKRISSWAPNTQAMINGFTWEGRDGTSTGQFGKANGHVHDFAVALGDNLSGGYTCDELSPPCSNYLSGGNKRVMFVPATGVGFSWADNSAAVVLSNTQSYVSSSTSIVKNGVCSTDALVSRWSAVGNTSGGRMIFMSSTSDGTTSAAELCPVFKAMGVVNAIRLDGGPSAAMTVNGVLVNELKGLYFVKYGNERYIPYALKMSYPGW